LLALVHPDKSEQNWKFLSWFIFPLYLGLIRYHFPLKLPLLWKALSQLYPAPN
jgi:hypothetical protein